MTAYLTDEIDPDEVERGHEEGVFTACKLYPAGATTNSAFGVTDVRNIHGVLERMQKIGMPLLVHGEVASKEIDIFDREAIFLEKVLGPMRSDFPDLKIVLEHITTADRRVRAVRRRIWRRQLPALSSDRPHALFDGGSGRTPIVCLLPSQCPSPDGLASRRSPAIQNSSSDRFRTSSAKR